MVSYIDVIKKLPKPQNKKELIFKNGNTANIIEVILETFEQYKTQTKSISNLFVSQNKLETLYNVWEFVSQNITYIEDKNGVQNVKSPISTLFDKNGDCKSISILIASILYNLGFEQFFRFVSYNKKISKVTHVYNKILLDNEKIVFLDGCVKVFNKEQSFFYNQDFKINQMAEIYKISKPNLDVTDFIGSLQEHKGNIVVIDKIGFLGDFLTNFDPTLQGSWANQTLPQLMVAFGIPPEVTIQVQNTLGQFGKDRGQPVNLESPDPRFNEQYYLTKYPDVADAVRRGQVRSGWHHYLVAGASEGRFPNDPNLIQNKTTSQVTLADGLNNNTNPQASNGSTSNLLPYGLAAAALLYIMSQKK